MQDIQAKQDDRGIKLMNVGVSDVQLPAILKQMDGRIQTTIANFTMGTSVKAEQKGAHMSRFIEILNSAKDRGYTLPVLTQMLERLKESQEAEEAYIQMAFKYFVERISPVTKKTCPMAINCLFTSSTVDGEFLEVKMPVMTLCPCSKEISDDGAHNQRAIVTVSIQSNAFIWIEEIVAVIDGCASSPVYPLLKRVDEKFVTEESYANPMFVEDVARELALAIEEKFLPGWYTIEVESQESIHSHNAFASQQGGRLYGSEESQ